MWPRSDVLTPEQQRAGFRVLENNRFLYIEKDGQIRLAFKKLGQTKEEIRDIVESLHTKE